MWTVDGLDGMESSETLQIKCIEKRNRIVDLIIYVQNLFFKFI